MSPTSTPSPFSALVAIMLALALNTGCPGTTPADGGVNDGGSGGEVTGARQALDAAIDDLVACADDDPYLTIYPNVTPEGTIIGRVPIMQYLPLVDDDEELSLAEGPTQACADLIQEIADTCDLRRLNAEDLEVYNTCDVERLVVGTRAAGEDCTDNPLSCAGTCAYDDTNGCSTCADFVEEGEPCESYQGCVDGTSCRSLNGELRCRAPAALGEACEWEDDCVDGAYCNNDNVCETEREPGEPCEDATSSCAYGCRFGDGEAVCSEPQAFVQVEEGEACHYPMGGTGDYVGCDFYSGVTCLVQDEATGDGVCTPFDFQAPGEPCDGPWVFVLSEFSYGNRLCANDLENYCHIDFFSGEPGECRARSQLGETCQSSSVNGITVPCADGLFCEDVGEQGDGVGECVPLAGEGEACGNGALDNWSYGCAYGLECDGEAPGGPTCVAFEDLYPAPMCAE